MSHLLATPTNSITIEFVGTDNEVEMSLPIQSWHNIVWGYCHGVGTAMTK